MSIDQWQWHLYGLVISAWSEWVSRPVLHAATLEVDGGAVGFLGDSGAGKSSLALEFLANGHRAFGDDQLVLDTTHERTLVVPSVPWFKVGVATAQRHVADVEALPKIHPMTDKRRLDLTSREWMPRPLPLRALYILERRVDVREICISPVAPAQALLALVRFAYVPRTISASGIAGTRLHQLAQALRHLTVCTLTYPEGYEGLPSVRRAVVNHMTGRADAGARL